MSKLELENPAPEPIGNVIERDLGAEMRSSYIDYSMSVIVGRALPDIRDGLKPVHRRILYAMHDEGLASNKKYSKCAGVVGEVLKKYHPHGDSAVYDALVRMVQDFSLLHPLIDGQGNFGSVDGDPAAAYRYTECRLAKFGEELLADIDQDTVDFLPNFDGTTVEPTVLPSRAPNLLVNGSSGIAVGMATNIPPHNLAETCEAAIALVKEPKLDGKEFMKIMKGPDFPTGGIVRGKAGIRDYFETGRGSVRVQAKTEIEDIKGNRQAIIVTELPYQVNNAALLETIADLVRDKKIPDISDIRDESDRKGMRVVIEVKRDGNANVVLNQLFKHTPMESSFGVILLSLVDGRPRVLPVRDMLVHFIGHRKVVVVRRTKFQLKKALDRAHILEGFLIAVKNIDRVIKIIRGAKDTDEAKGKLISEFTLSKVQAQAILDMRLAQLTKLSVNELQEEYDGLMKRIAELKGILADVKKVMAIVVKELEAVQSQFGRPRQTQITTEAAEMTLEDLIAKEEVLISQSSGGYIKRIPVATYQAQGRGGKGITGAEVKDEDFIENFFITDTHATLLFFTNRGRVFQLKAYEVPQATRTAKGQALVNFLQLAPHEKVTSILDLADLSDYKYLVLVTQKGLIKKVDIQEITKVRKSGLIAIKLKGGDVLGWTKPSTGHDDIILVTSNGMSVRFKEKDIRPMGRAAAGVRGIRLKGADVVVRMDINEKAVKDENLDLLVVMENGFGKRTGIKEYRLQRRGGTGIKAAKITSKTGKIVGARLLNNKDLDRDMIIISERGQVIRLPLKSVNRLGRATQGIHLMRFKEAKDKVASLALI